MNTDKAVTGLDCAEGGGGGVGAGVEGRPRSHRRGWRRRVACHQEALQRLARPRQSGGHGAYREPVRGSGSGSSWRCFRRRRWRFRGLETEAAAAKGLTGYPRTGQARRSRRGRKPRGQTAPSTRRCGNRGFRWGRWAPWDGVVSPRVFAKWGCPAPPTFAAGPRSTGGWPPSGGLARVPASPFRVSFARRSRGS